MRAIAVGLLACGMILAMPAMAGQTVAVESGTVRGSVEGGVQSWKGIPFAAPPVGALRWRAPQTAAKWTGVRDAIAYEHDCMQLPFGGDAAPLGTSPAEDCLYLNVWRPAGEARKLPVIVWVYGGGFVNGGASPPTYSGANMAKQGVMFVSFNYRVGRFGTFAHPQLTRENADHGLLGNYGYMDQIAALRWVQRNIGAFGGDPKNVTIVGESAGGMSVHALATSPLAKGLFARAIVMSGGDGAAMSDGGLGPVEKIGIAFAQAKGIAPDDPQALRKLRALSADDVTDGLNLMAMFRPATEPRSFASPFVDGKLAVDTGQAYASGAFAHVPMMIGATSDDIGGKTGFMVRGARAVSATIAGKGVPVYEYRFSYVAPSVRTAKTKGAGHASDIPFFFHTEAIKYGVRTTPADVETGRTISAYIVNFARTGNPNGPGLPTWPRYSKAEDRLIDFGADGRVKAEKDPWGADIDAAPPKPTAP